MPLAIQLTEDPISEMIRLRQAGCRIKALALQFHIEPDKVRCIVTVADTPAPPVIRPLPDRVVKQVNEDGDEVYGARPVDDDEVDEFIAAFEGIAPLSRYFMARGPGDYLAEVLVDADDYDRIMCGPSWRLQRTNYGWPGSAHFYVVRAE